MRQAAFTSGVFVAAGGAATGEAAGAGATTALCGIAVIRLADRHPASNSG